MTRRWVWSVFYLLLAFFILTSFSDKLVMTFGSTSPIGSALRLVFPSNWTKDPITAAIGELEGPLFAGAALLVLGELLHPATAWSAMWQLPRKIRHSWREILAAFALALGALGSIYTLQQILFSPSGWGGIIPTTAISFGVLVNLGCLLCAWRLLFRPDQSGTWPWLGVLTATGALGSLALLLWSIVAKNVLHSPLFGQPGGLSLFLLSPIVMYALEIWVGLAIARGLVMGDPAAEIAPASNAAQGRLLLAGVLVTTCFHRLVAGLAYPERPGTWLAAPVLIGIGYLALIQLVQALGALGLTHAVGVPTAYRRTLSGPMVALLILAGLAPLLIFTGCVLLLGAAFSGMRN